MDKIVVYGLGNEFEKNKKELVDEYEIIAYSDIKEKVIEGYIYPKQLECLDYDYILVMPCTKRKEITNYLVNECNIKYDKIKYYMYEKNSRIYSLFEKDNAMGLSYAENAEDYIIDGALREMGITKNVSYIELGVNEPVLNSNTYYFYQRGELVFW